ncbi:STN domain-containing protein [Delftia sp. Lp-1]|uniref:STN domain-containing protein n=1 Tax=Delftia sp. Lp-1 TaxID=682863 RepID=UPI001E56C2CA|nr:STN domain-containing protein [Delftia sp. Lp-1]MCB4785855.1 STN domain-containing protein [Delftia sp. Lp-1]
MPSLPSTRHAAHPPSCTRPTALATQALALGLLITLGLPATALAQSPSSAPDARSIRFDLPAGDLETSLHSLARQAGITLSFDPALVQGRQSAALSGTRGLQEGLAALLAPHQLQATRTAEGGWAVHRARPGAAAEHALPTVNVLADAEHESAWGAVPGYAPQRLGHEDGCAAAGDAAAGQHHRRGPDPRPGHLQRGRGRALQRGRASHGLRRHR